MMLTLNTISENPYFRNSSLYHSFRKNPFGFIDIGAAGGVHPLVMPVASLTHCICFEPDEEAYEELLRKYNEHNPFSKISVLRTAVGARSGKAKLYITQSAVNTSLLEPREELLTRYGKSGFQIKQVILFGMRKPSECLGELIKMDCQGAEYPILKGAERTLQQCVALLCEVMFFPMYKGQKIFSDIDLFLRSKGFQLYGLYPNYISAKKLDRTKYDTEERIVWADALYFRDPFGKGTGSKKWARRNVEALLLSALLLHFYDFALEIADGYFGENQVDRDALRNLTRSLAEERKKALEAETDALSNGLRESPEKAYLLAKKFIDKNKSNNSLDYIKV
jgi:FkbM family methyltransferase